MTPIATPLPPVSAQPRLALDGSVWDAMLEAAGPQDAVWLVRQIVADLNWMRDGLTAALAQGDATTLRRVSHALAGLGGTIGAPHLHKVAQRLSDTARQEDLAIVATIGVEMQDTLACVLALVEHRLSAMGAA